MVGKMTSLQIWIALGIYVFICLSTCTWFSIQSKRDRARYAKESEEIRDRIMKEYEARQTVFRKKVE